jgi:hypothetical protein
VAYLDSNLMSLAYHVAMKSSLTKFNEYMSQRTPSKEMIVLYRNMGFGGGAICLVLLLGIAQIKSGPNPALTISVLSASFSLPLWLLFGVIYFIEPFAIWPFSVAVLIAVFAQLAFHRKLATWWYQPDGPGSSPE